MKIIKILSRVFAGLVLLLILLAGLTAFVLPAVIKQQAVKWVAANSARTLKIEGLHVNPLTWRIELRGVSLSEADDSATFAGFERLLLDVSARSLFNRALIITEAQLASPTLRIVRTAENRFNYSDLLEGKTESRESPEGSGEPLRFSVNNIRLSNGSIDVLDQGLAVEKVHRVRDIELTIPFVGNTPYLADQYVTPALSAEVNGAPFRVEGQLKPFAEAVEAAVKVTLDRVEAPYYLAYVPADLPFRVEFGNVSTDLDITYRASAREQPRLTVAGDLSLSVLTLRDSSGGRIFFLPLVMAKMSPSRILEQELSLTSLMLYDMEVWLSRDARGIWSHSRLAGDRSAGPGAEAKSGEPDGMRVSVEQARLFDGKFHFDDQLPAGGFKAEIVDIDLEVGRFSTAPGQTTPFEISLYSKRGEKGMLQGEFALDPLAVHSAVALQSVPLEAYYPYLAAALTAPVQGRLGASATIDLTDQDGFQVKGGKIQVDGLAVPFSGSDGLFLRQVKLGGGDFDLKARRLAVASVAFGEGNLQLSRDTQGEFSPLALVRRQPQEAPAAPEKQAAAAPFSYQVRTVTGGSLAVSFTDGLSLQKPTYSLGGLSFAIQGRGDADAGLSISPDEGFRIARLDVELKDLALPFEAGDGLRLKRIDLRGGALALKDRRLELDSVALVEGELSLSRDAKGRLSALSLVPEAPGGPGTQKEEPKAEAAAAPFAYRVKSITGKGLDVAFTDGMKPRKPKFDFSRLSFSVDELAGPKPSSSPFVLAATYGRNGAFKASGRVVPAPLDFNGEFGLQRIPLTDFVAYLPEQLHLELTGGTLDAKLALGLRQKGEGLDGEFRGDLGIRNFSCLDAADRQELLSWESLQLGQVGGTLRPFSLGIGEVALSNYRARVIIDQGGKLNLQKIYGADRTEAVAAPTRPAAEEAPGARTAIRIDAITLQGGALDFTDNHLPRAFSTRMLNLGGRVSGLSSDPESLADVDLRGNLENQSPLSITGQLNPLRGDLFADLKVSFQDIELSPMTPYTVTYLGYPVERGKLSLDLKYLIEQARLDSSNRVFLDQFTLGEKVASEQATGLPVKLALALMKDRNGEIHLDLPVSGRTDDPEFSVVGVVVKLLKNLVVKAATAPFSLLASMFGGGQENFSTISFPNGSARLAEPERDKLTKLADILRDRPALKLKVMGYVDKASDPEAYRSERLQVLLKTARYNELAAAGQVLAGQTIEEMEIPAAQYADYLEEVYKQADFPKPRNFFGMVKGLPEEEMKKLLLANLLAGEEQMQALAWGRATVVKNFLVNEGGLPAERIFLERTDIFTPPEDQGAGGSRVEFGIATR